MSDFVMEPQAFIRSKLSEIRVWLEWQDMDRIEVFEEIPGSSEYAGMVRFYFEGQTYRLCYYLRCNRYSIQIDWLTTITMPNGLISTVAEILKGAA